MLRLCIEHKKCLSRYPLIKDYKVFLTRFWLPLPYRVTIQKLDLCVRPLENWIIQHLYSFPPFKLLVWYYHSKSCFPFHLRLILEKMYMPFESIIELTPTWSRETWCNRSISLVQLCANSETVSAQASKLLPSLFPSLNSRLTQVGQSMIIAEQ